MREGKPSQVLKMVLMDGVRARHVERVVGKSPLSSSGIWGLTCKKPDECVMGKFKDLRVGMGGLKLVHAVLSCSNWENCHILSHPFGMQPPSMGLVIQCK